jgi:hypothetical protein
LTSLVKIYVNYRQCFAEKLPGRAAAITAIGSESAD